MFINIKLHLGSIYNLPPVDHYIQWHTFWFILWFGIGSLQNYRKKNRNK